MADDEAASIILGSASPRRAELLAGLGVAFSVEPVDLDEDELVVDSDSAESVAERIAIAKFRAFGARAIDGQLASPLLLTADTVVSCDGLILGKPGDDDAHAVAMLERISGRSISIASGVCSGPVGGEPVVQVVTTEVQVRELSIEQIVRYVASGAGRDKAAGLALQSEAASFIAAVRGCWSNVVGLPLCAVVRALDVSTEPLPRAERCAGERCGARR